MTEATIREVTGKFAEDAKKIYGSKLRSIILYGSCARGDFDTDSDIDMLVLLDVPQDQINEERRRILDVSDRLDLEYDTVLAPVFQTNQAYLHFMPVSVFYQNVEREGVRVV